MRLPRMTTRRWMVVVVVIGLLLGGGVGVYRLKQRRDRFRSRAQLHEEMAAVTTKLEEGAREYSAFVPRHIAELERQGREGGSVEPLLQDVKAHLDRSRKELARWPRLTAYHVAMARKYRRAARYPWLPVEPDPPRPE